MLHLVNRPIITLVLLPLHRLCLRLLRSRISTSLSKKLDKRLLSFRKLFNEGTPAHLTEEHVPVLQWFFHLFIDEPSGGLPSTPVDVARQLWDLMDAHCA